MDQHYCPMVNIKDIILYLSDRPVERFDELLRSYTKTLAVFTIQKEEMRFCGYKSSYIPYTKVPLLRACE
jgi:hypothetical protein